MRANSDCGLGAICAEGERAMTNFGKVYGIMFLLLFRFCSGSAWYLSHLS